MSLIRVAISGYGNVGRGVEQAIARSSDMKLVAVVTRRPPGTVTLATPEVRVVHEEDVRSLAREVDVMVLCGGSATDLPQQGPAYASLFNTVDSFDTHARIPEYYETMNRASRDACKLSLISCGWDPGLFSILRTYGLAMLPQGDSYTFWGRGVSQGHSDAIRRIAGVQGGIQYTQPIDSAVEAVRSGTSPTLTTRQKHTRHCYVVAEEGADRAAIEQEIKTMPNYFADYDTFVEFITAQELREQHGAMPHGGMVLRTGETGSTGNKHVMELSLRLDSNPEFTASIMVAYARAVYRMVNRGDIGCITVLDVPPAMLTQQTREELRKELL